MNAQWTEPEARWRRLREQFRLDPSLTHMNAMLMTSHPDPVREAIERYEEELDRDPQGYLHEHAGRLFDRVAATAGRYLGLPDPERTGPCLIALTDSTTMGLGLLFNGIMLKPSQHVLLPRSSPYFSVQALTNRVDMAVGQVLARAPGQAAALSKDPCATLEAEPPGRAGTSSREIASSSSTSSHVPAARPR